MDEFPTVLQSSAGRVKDLNKDMVRQMMVTMVMAHLASVIHVNSDASEDVPSLIDQGG